MSSFAEKNDYRLCYSCMWAVRQDQNVRASQTCIYEGEKLSRESAERNEAHCGLGPGRENSVSCMQTFAYEMAIERTQGEKWNTGKHRVPSEVHFNKNNFTVLL